MLSTSATFRLISANLDRSLATTRAQASVALESRYYLDHIGNVKSVDDFLKDRRLFTFAMKAFGLDDMLQAGGFMRKILNEGVADPKAFANRLTDKRFAVLARVFNFEALGESATQGAHVRQGVVDRYVRQALESQAGSENEGVRLALYFQREAPAVKSAYGLLADPALWQVVKTAFGFPDEMANAPVEKQAAAVLARMSLDDLTDPTKLDRLINRFTAVWDATNATQADPVLALFNQDAAAQSVDLETIIAMKSLKYGGP
jgi:hypothetical protein